MAKKALRGEKVKQVGFEIDKDAFFGPFKCHSKTKLVAKKVSIGENVFAYSAWQCAKCKKEYLDSGQAKKMEDIWTVEKFLKDDVITMKRSLNYDGKMFFLRFPIELTKKWKKGQFVDITPIDSNRFIVEVKC